MYSRVKSRAEELALSRNQDADHEEDRRHHDADDQAPARRSHCLAHTGENENPEYATSYLDCLAKPVDCVRDSVSVDVSPLRKPKQTASVYRALPR